jgi:3-phosphoshikimate 1-carboxyvinyltransferase
MSFAVASLRASAPIRIQNTLNVGTSFPNFLELAKVVGIDVDRVDAQ